MDWSIISDSEPTNNYTGKLWLRPGIAGVKTTAAFLKMGGSYIPLAVIDGIPFEYQRLTVLIDGINISDPNNVDTVVLEKNSLIIRDILTTAVDVCRFSIIDSSGNNKPEVGQEVIIFYKETDTSSPVLRFGGRIVSYNQEQIDLLKYRYSIVVNDYTQDLIKKLVNESYASQTMGYIIKDIIGTYAPHLGTFDVPDGPVINYIAFSYKFVNECIIELVQIAAYNYYVDYYKQLQIVVDSGNPAPYEITDVLNDSEYSNLVINVDKSELINSQIVKGAFEFFEDDYPQTWVVQPGQTELPIAYEPYPADSGAIELYIDGGSKITPGEDNVDTTDDYVINVNEKVLKDQNGNWSGGESVVLIYKYKIPIFARVIDENSINNMINYEGGDGIYEGAPIVDELIETKAAARERGQAKIILHKDPIINGEFNTTKYGFKSGQLLVVNSTSRLINNSYLIQEVTAESLGMGLFRYTIVFSNNRKDFNQFLINLFDRSAKVLIRYGEIIENFKILQDSVIVSDTVSGTKRNIVTNPAKWSNDEGTTSDKIQWNLGQWG